MSSPTSRLGRHLETLVALLLLAALIGGFIASLGGCDLERGRYWAAKAQAARLESAIEGFRRDCGRLPDQLDELSGDPRNRDCFTAPQRPSQLVDPWGSRFAYRQVDGGRAFELHSAGRDRIHGNADDATSGGWDRSVTQPAWSWRRIGQWTVPATIALVAGVLMRRLAAMAMSVIRRFRRWLRRT
ncbi:type II secretion system protein GspG [Tahibacter caeni]|uniref:type II secretion system protein GspG n=1 Tax=Tahibacter caeni TaxID=1453545 RepID=UPI0021488B5C|nr:type II secretion system protein GspG [Tahibacter caeni]